MTAAAVIAAVWAPARDAETAPAAALASDATAA
jgi:hypothetical protein